MGSNSGHAFPALRIYNNKFIYTREANSSFWFKKSEKSKFVSRGAIRQSSVDSIISLVKGLKDSSIRRTNMCIMSGGIYYITVANGTDTTNFTLYNTFDSTALKIINIINPYLPVGKKLYGSADEIRSEEECWDWLRKTVEHRQDSIKAKQ